MVFVVVTVAVVMEVVVCLQCYFTRVEDVFDFRVLVLGRNHYSRPLLGNTKGNEGYNLSAEFALHNEVT